jgi:hypothetical protein
MSAYECPWGLRRAGWPCAYRAALQEWLSTDLVRQKLGYKLPATAIFLGR